MRARRALNVLEDAGLVYREVTRGTFVYFCDPASPWHRGSNENTNGMLRQYFPKE
jgi:IS30 family transposase